MEPNFEQVRIDELVFEMLSNITAGNVTPQLIDLYRRTKYALDRQGGGELGPQTLSLMCAVSGAIKLPHEKAYAVETGTAPPPPTTIVFVPKEDEDGELTDAEVAEAEKEFDDEELEALTRPEPVAQAA